MSTGTSKHCFPASNPLLVNQVLSTFSCALETFLTMIIHNWMPTEWELRKVWGYVTDTGVGGCDDCDVIQVHRVLYTLHVYIVPSIYILKSLILWVLISYFSSGVNLCVWTISKWACAILCGRRIWNSPKCYIHG